MKIDPHSDTWRAVEAWAKAQLAVHDAQLRLVGLPLDKTEGARYAIRELESLLSLSKAKAITQFPASSDPSL